MRCSPCRAPRPDLTRAGRRCTPRALSGVALGLLLTGAVASACGNTTTASHGTSTTQVQSSTTRPSATIAPTTATAPLTTPAPSTTTPVPSLAALAPPKTALAGLSTLPIKGRAPKTGYSRAQFGPAWTDDVTVAGGHNGCDTRDDILRRDLTSKTIKPGTHGCVVLSGVLRDPYTNTVIRFNRASPNNVQIDHVVSLADAWQTGAQKLTLKVRTNFANDPLNLLAVSASINIKKGDSDAASWLPPNKAFRCSFVARQVAVKITYHLWVTRAEHDAIARVLATCPSQPLPTEKATAPPPLAATPALPPTTAKPPPTTAKKPTPTTAKPPSTTAKPVTPGAFCSPAGAKGVTSKGVRMTCTTTPTDFRYRWRQA